MWNPFKKTYTDEDGLVLYYMSTSGSDDNMVFHSGNTSDGVRYSTQDWDNVLRGEKHIDQTRVFFQVHGNILCDVCLFGDMLLTVSPKFRKILIENNITGWKSEPVRLRLKSGEIVERYHVLQIVGRCKPYDKQDFEDPYFWIAKDWDGSDIVIMDDSSAKIVTPHVKDLLEANNITGISFKKVLVLED